MKRYFKDTSNFLSFALALIPAILLFIFKPTDAVPYSIFAITVLLLLLSFWLALKLYLDSKETLYPAIKVFRCKKGKCLCKPNPYLSLLSAISFYKNENGFEELLCYGYVETINEKGMIQIVILNNDNTDKGSDAFSYISKHQNDIIIKPTVSIEQVQITH